MSKPLAMTAAVASHRSILHMFTFTTSPGEWERERGDGEEEILEKSHFPKEKALKKKIKMNNGIKEKPEKWAATFFPVIDTIQKERVQFPHSWLQDDPETQAGASFSQVSLAPSTEKHQ